MNNPWVNRVDRIVFVMILCLQFILTAFSLLFSGLPDVVFRLQNESVDLLLLVVLTFTLNDTVSFLDLELEATGIEVSLLLPMELVSLGVSLTCATLGVGAYTSLGSTTGTLYGMLFFIFLLTSLRIIFEISPKATGSLKSRVIFILEFIIVFVALWYALTYFHMSLEVFDYVLAPIPLFLIFVKLRDLIRLSKS